MQSFSECNSAQPLIPRVCASSGGGSRKRTALFPLLAIVPALVGCRGVGPQASTQAQANVSWQPPTASEVFNLRTKCVELSEKINGEYDLTLRGLPPDPKRPPIALSQAHFSHYDPKTNRCYVELRVVPDMVALSVSPAVRETFLARFEIDFRARHLYDGQTGDELASMQKGIKSVAPAGFVKDDKVPWYDASTKIDELMADDRKQ